MSSIRMRTLRWRGRLALFATALVLAGVATAPGSAAADRSASLPGHVAAGGERDIGLDGSWRFRTDPERTGEQSGFADPATDVSAWDRVDVPSNWDVHDRYAHYRGAAWYRRAFTVPGDARGGVARLRFDAVYWTARVWLNGKPIGTHSGGYTPFELDVSDDLAPGTNVLAVEADNTYAQGAWWPWGGLSRGVSLVLTGDVYADHERVTAAPDLQSGAAEVRTTVTIANRAREDRMVTVSGQVTGADGEARIAATAADLQRRVTVPAGGSADVTLSATLPRGSYQLWDIDHPALYRFRTTVLDGRGGVHQVSDRFGIRRIELRGTGLFLNGERVRLNGYNRVQDDRVNGNVEPTHAVRRDLDQMKAAGANMMRLNCVPQAPELLDYADEIGLLVITEVPVWGRGRDISPAGYGSIQAEMREMVRRDFNHPSIMAYSVANEIQADTPTGRAYDKVMVDFVHRLDPTRFATQVSNSYPRAKRPEDDGSQYMDFLSINLYGDFAANADHAHALWPDKPVFVSEFSPDGSTFPVTREGLDFRTAADALAGPFARRPWLIGASQWTYNDYRSGYRGSSANEVRGWGVVDVWRHKKRAYAQVQKANAPVRGLGLYASPGSGRRVTVLELEPRRSLDGDLPAFTLRGYRLTWQAHDAAGSVLAGRIVDLPTIAPASGKLRYSVAWDDPGRAVAQTVTLLAPTGHEVAQATQASRAPAVPRIEQTVATRSSARVRFTPVAGADGYRVQARRDGRVVASVDTIESFADLTGLANGQAYALTVTALDGAGASDAAEAAVTPTALTGGLPPRVAALEPLPGGLVLGFSDAARGGRFEVRVARASDGAELRRYSTTVRGATRIEGLRPGERHRVQIRSITADGIYSAWSEPLTATPDPPAGGAPGPVVRGAVAGAESVGIRIAPSRLAERYVVDLQAPGAPSVRRVIERAAVELLPVEGLRPGTRYQATVRAETAAGPSPAWTGPVATRSRPMPPVLAPPTGLGHVTAGDTTRLTWDPVAGAAGYLVADCHGEHILGTTTETSLAVAKAGEASGRYVVAALADDAVGPGSEPYVLDEQPGARAVVVTPEQNQPHCGPAPFAAIGTWRASTLPGVDGTRSLYTNASGARATWTPDLGTAGRYLVQAWFPTNPTTTTATDFTVAHAGGSSAVRINQRDTGGAWVTLGTWQFPAGTRSSVTLEHIASSGYTRANAVRFTPVTG